MRLFFAAMLPPEVQGPLAHLRENFAWVRTPASWSAQENIHITLKFLGEVPEQQVADISSALKLQSQGLMKLRVSHPVLFPETGAVRVLGVGFEGDTQRLVELQKQIERYCQPLGFTREARRYIPHATLARFRNGLHAKHRIRIEQSMHDLHTMPSCELREIQLMQSELSPKGSRYSRIATYPL